MAIKVVATINQQDMEFTGEQLGITDIVNDTDTQVLTAVRGAISEQIQDDEGRFTFAVRRALNTETIYVYPKPTFG